MGRACQCKVYGCIEPKWDVVKTMRNEREEAKNDQQISPLTSTTSASARIESDWTICVRDHRRKGGLRRYGRRPWERLQWRLQGLKPRVEDQRVRGELEQFGMCKVPVGRRER